MALKTIPVRGDSPNYDFTVTLDGADFKFEFQWNERCSCWTFDLSDGDGNLLVGSVQVVVSWPILARFKSATLPLGTLFFYDTTSKGMDPQLISDLGSRVLLMYQEASS